MNDDAARSHEDEKIADATIARLKQVVAVFTALLVWSTWPLWIPGGEFPDTPWFPGEDRLSQPFDGCFLASWGLLGILQFVPFPRNRRWPRVLKAALLTGSLLLLPGDQHRLQPWVWQFAIMAVVMGVSPNDRITLACLRGLTISIYFWSAVSKVDWAFLDGRGQWLLEGLATALHLSSAMWSDGVRHSLAAAFPIGELAVATALLFRPSRRFGLWLATAMHVLLIIMLGPWGQGQLPGVLIWNGYFIAQNLLLFRRRRDAFDPGLHHHDRPRDRIAKLQTWTAMSVTGIVCLMPALSSWGYWDHWPSWAVYSERPAIVQMYVTGEDAKRLPATLRPFVGPPAPLMDWRPVNLDAWSFAVCRCPIYPQKRYRLALIAQLQQDCEIAPQIVIKGPPNRWTGKRVLLQGLRTKSSP